MKFKLYEPKRGHPDFDKCRDQALALAKKIGPLVKKDADLSAAEKMRDALRRGKALGKLAENYYVNRKRYREGDHTLRPLYVIWTLLNECNFRCTYCDNHQGKAYYDMPGGNRLDTEGGKRLLKVMATGTPSIYWCGGEPTLRNDLPELLDTAWDLGFFPNMINTNGSILHKRLQDEKWQNFLWQMDIVILSLDCLNLARLNKLWGVKTARQVIVNLLLLRELRKRTKFKLTVNTVITPDTIEEARSVLDLACDLDLWFVPVPVNYKHKPDRKMITDPRYRELVELILRRKKQGYKIIGSYTLLKRMLYAEPNKCFTALKPHVWPDGSICWPCRASANVRPVDIGLLDYDSFDAAYRAGAKRINPNFFHGPAKNQCGGQCAWMQNYTTARYIEGIVDPVRSGLLGELFEFALNPRNW